MKKILKNLMIMMWSLLAGVAATSCVTEDEPQWSLQAGDELPVFAVRTLDGQLVTDESFVGKKGYIVFFTTTCGDCRRELPNFEAQYRALMESEEAEDVLYICISRAEDATAVLQYWEAEGLTMPVAAEPDRSVYDLFATSGIPRQYVTDGTRIIETTMP